MKKTSLFFFGWSLVFVLLLPLGASAQQRYLNQHPRLLFTAEEESELKQLLEKNAEVRALDGYITAMADSFCAVPQIAYEFDRYGNMLHTSRAYVLRLGTLSLAYRLHGDRKYLDAANEALLWVCRFPDWDPKHFLDNAEMASAVAIAYDWLYDVLPVETSRLVKQCLYERAIRIVLREYEKGGGGSWAKRDTNWNVVCNTGMVLAVLAVAEDYPDEAATILDNAAHFMPNCLNHFAPDGVCYEGPAYWGYTWRYLACYLKAVADNDEGRGGIARLSGLERSGLYNKRTLTPTGRVFNFANAGKDAPDCCAYFFISKFYRQPEVAQWYRGEINKIIAEKRKPNQLFFLSLPWFDIASPKGKAKLPRMEVYHNTINDIIVFNGDRNKKASLYLIAKGGEPDKAHQQQDCGTFLVESEGVCWTEDLGSDDYALPGFWDGKPNGKRWQYFRNNNFGHNTLSIDDRIMYSAGEAFVCEEQSEGSRPYAKLDMTSLFQDQADKVTRRFTLVDDRTMEIEDELELTDSGSCVSWMAITKAQAEAKGRDLHLRQNGKHFYMRIVSPADASFETLPTPACEKGEYPIEGVTRIVAKCRFPQGKGKIIVRMSSKAFK
ncbi:MAG: heparinase II/III family protein [Bacteroidaceae bacterium]